MAGESQQVPGSSPDPTVITTENIDKAIAQSEKLTDAKLNVAKAEGLALHNICIEKFKSMESTFGLVERQRVEQKADSKTAIDDALAAAKEAVKEQTTASQLATGKTETSFAEQLRQQEAKGQAATVAVTAGVNDLKDQVILFLPRTEYAANHQNLADRVSDLTDRINRSEGQARGYSAVYGWVVGAAAIIVAVVIAANSLAR